ncbi:MAG: pilus assembly protein PilZ [Geobacteraceae bacterium GWC2_58_44]|nr:MAG: pilus assembly protein PilZ [Geobacteraceae bacterium GWC2_58_44]HBG06172.1 PilZ domain-containing protein [Geobacter sp.]
MQKELCNYRDYFHPGQRARVEMSLQDDRMFNDGAVVTSVGDRQIALRLSRDTLPDGALLHRAAPLVVRVGGSGSGYSCRGVVLNEHAGDELRIEFVDRVISEDLREYFRLDAEIPVILFNVTAGTAEESGTGGLRLAALDSLPRIVNISGGGLRTETEMAMTIGDIVYATFHLPLPEPKVVPVVAQVVHSELIERADGAIISSGLSFMHINERDRDTIVRYVCNEEIKRIRLCRKDFFSLPEN